MPTLAKRQPTDRLAPFRLPCGKYTMAKCQDCGGLYPPSLTPRVNGHEDRCPDCYPEWARKQGRRRK